MKRYLFFAAVAVSGLCAVAVPRSLAQDFLAPEQSEAKARQIMDQAIAAFGGPAYLNMHDETCTGHAGQFEHSGAMSGYGQFILYAEPPLKERQENLPQRNEIDVFNGDKGWNLDRGGVSDEPESVLSKFQNDTQVNINNILTHRIHEKDMVIRYAGDDIVDLKQVDWVELVDSDDRTIRIAFDRATHLPIRKTVETRDPKFRTTTQETEIFANFHAFNGITTPLQRSGERNGQAAYQIFYDSCSLNTGLDESLFTRESLEQRFAKIGKKPKPDKSKKDSSSADSGKN